MRFVSRCGKYEYLIFEELPIVVARARVGGVVDMDISRDWVVDVDVEVGVDAQQTNDHTNYCWQLICEQKKCGAINTDWAYSPKLSDTSSANCRIQ